MKLLTVVKETELKCLFTARNDHYLNTFLQVNRHEHDADRGLWSDLRQKKRLRS